MAILSRGQTFASGDQVTAQKLQDIVDLATFDDPADESTIVKDTGTGKLKVPSNGIGSNELASDASVDANRAVNTDHIKDNAVTYDKIQDVAANSVIGNTTGSTATPTNVAILDEDNMVSDSNTSLVTQQSVKAYVDNQISQVSTQVSKYTSTWFNNATGLANGGTYSFSHDLGITDILVQVYVSDNSSGTNPQLVSYLSHAPGSVQTYGATITNITSNVIDVQLGSYGYLDISNVGYQTLTTFVGKYIKVVAIG